MPNLTCKYEKEVLVAYRDYDFDMRQLGRMRKLRCRDCGGFVHLKKGELKIAHFAHFPDQETPKCSRSNESQEHYECKSFVAKLLESRYSADKVFPEHTLESGQEADVFLELPTGKFAFEVQFSQQDQQEWKARTELYKNHGIFPVWILGFRKGIKQLQKADYLHIAIPLTMQNAGIELPDYRQWERSLQQTPYVREEQNGRSHIFHLITYEDNQIGFYVAYLKRTPEKKTLWYGDILPIGRDWDFLEQDSRFAPEREGSFNRAYFEKQEKQKALDAKIRAQNDRYQERLASEQERRSELKARLFTRLKVEYEAEIPELKMQYDEHQIERIFTIKARREPNEIPDRLIAEIAVYYKFIKIKPIGFEFSYAHDVEPFLREWGFCSEENRQYAAAQISSGFLARLRQMGVLDKSPRSDYWKVSRKLLPD